MAAIKCLVIVLTLGLGIPIWAESVNIALVSDGAGARAVIPVKLLKQEIRTLLEPQFQVSFVERNGGWSEKGVSQTLQGVLGDPGIDIVITEGLVGTHIAGKLPSLNKPVIGVFVPEPKLQGLPLTKDKTSGKRNYTYISDLKSFDLSLHKVLSILPKKKIALIADQLILDGIPALADPKFYGDSDVSLITATHSLSALIERIPSNVGSVMIAPLNRFSRKDIRKLANILIDRGLPSVSFAADIGVRDGILLSVGTNPDEVQKPARRVALNVLSVLEGTNAAQLPVEMPFGNSLQFNEQTAEALGFELPWEILLTATAYTDPAVTIAHQRGGMSLQDAVTKALDQNLNLARQRLDQNIALDDLAIARSSWWPQLTLNTQATKLDKDVTSASRAENSVDASLSLNQLLYSEEAKSGLDIAKMNQKIARYQLDAVILDTIQQVSSAYISVLRTKALEKVQRSNLSATVKNLELAKNRFSLGAVTESDVLRWKSQVATDKRNLLVAQTNVHNAIVTLQNLLHQPLTDSLHFNERDTQRLIAMSLNKQVRKIFDTPTERHVMTQFILKNAIENAPEIKQIKLANAISARSTRAAERAFYLPSFRFSAQYNNNVSRSGQFASQAEALLPDTDWSVGLTASYPIFQGRKRHADLAKARHQERQTQLNGHLIEDNIRANALSSWNAIGSSYPAIFLSREAADAGHRTLRMIREQYSSGAINITTLIDAQNAALASELAAAEAQYVYLIDFVNLGRAVSDFRAITGQGAGNSWLKEFYEFKQRLNR